MRKPLECLGAEMLRRFGMARLPALIGADLSRSLKIGIPKLF
jgi:hypothetical protein